MSLAFGLRQPCDQRPDDTRAEPCAQRQQRWVLAVAVLGSSLAFIEGSIVNLALPSLQSDLGIDSLTLQWIINAYLLTLSSFMLIGGAAGDRVGLRRVYVAGLLLFGFSSVACGVVSAPAALIGWRALQGVGAALLVPTSLALINVYFGPAERPRAIGIWASASALTTAAGPLVGGALVDLFGWRAVFLLIAPLAFAACVLAVLKVPKRSVEPSEPLDIAGAVLLMTGLAVLTYALVELGERDRGWLLVFVALATLGGFVLFEHRSRHPMLPLGLFASGAFSGANLMTVLLYFALGGALYFVPFNLVQIQGYSALAAGAAFLPLSLTLGLGSALAGERLGRYSPRSLLTFGAALTAGGLALLMLPAANTSYLIDWLPGIAVVGIGMTLCVAPLTTVVMGSVADDRAGTASGVNNTAARLAGLFAIAGLTSLATLLFSRGLSDAATAGVIAPSLLADAAELGGLLNGARDLGPAARAAVSESYVAMFRFLMGACSALALVSALTAWLTLKSSKPQPSA